MKEFVRNLTDFSLYMKKKEQKDKVPIAEIFIKKMNNFLIERRQKSIEKQEDTCAHEIIIPFQLKNESSNSMAVFLKSCWHFNRRNNVF